MKLGIIVVFCGYLFHANCVEASSNDISTTPPILTLGRAFRITIWRIKYGFLHLPEDHLEQLEELREYLNEDGLMDSFQKRIEAILKEPLDRILPGISTWLLIQDPNDVYQSMQNFNKNLKSFQNWLNQNANLNFTEILEQVQQSKSGNDDPEFNLDEDFSIGELLIDLFNSYVSVFWKLGFENFLKLGELLEFLDRNGGEYTGMLFRMLDVQVKMGRFLGNRDALQRIMPKIADWILVQNYLTVRKWVKSENIQLKMFSKWMDDQGY